MIRLRVRERLKNYLDSGWEFTDSEMLLKQRFNLMNIIFLLAFAGLIEGVIENTIKHYYALVLLELFMLLFFLFCIILLRRQKRNYDGVTTAIALISLLFFNALIFFSALEDIKFIWLFFYVVTFLFLKGNRAGLGWIVAMIASLFVLKFQPLYPIYLSHSQLYYLVFVMSIITTMTYFFQYVIDKGFDLILEQRAQLQNFNDALEKRVEEKTEALQRLNDSLAETIAQKVSEVKEQQEMLIAQSRLAAMGEMLSMIAHQWRQPLATTTLKITDMNIKSMLHNEKRDARDELLEQVSDTLLYLSDTIDDFQTYFKPDNKTEKANVAELAERACSFVRARLDIYKIEASLEGNRDASIETFPNELVQVLINILNNAIDAIIAADKSEKNIRIRIEKEERGVVINIEDSGEGIDAAVVSRVFEPYFSTKSKNGTGLGLYMAKMIIEEHMQGEITASNIKEGGACFCIKLPFKNTFEEKAEKDL